ncbi:MAG: 3-phosphoshikimate 1-carboxyvinyltransferase, partial [Bacteroidales bacterium]|nr:3-phosphoshikimate 1-carboxyvinyltransferase [Bacteroidales bacterium]
AGANITTESSTVKAVKSMLKAFDFDATESPDLFPPLVCLAINCSGTSRIKGVTRLEHKESDRGLTIVSVLNRLGIKTTVSDDIMLVEGGEVKGATVSSHNDHRIAMMAAVAALKGDGPVTVTEAEAVSKSYPEFFSDLKNIGADIRY